MNGKLTSSQVVSYALHAKSLYQEVNLPEEAIEKLIKYDIEVFNNMIKWTEILEKDPSITNSLASASYFLEVKKQIPLMYKKMGCTEEQHQAVISLGSRLVEVECVKSIFDRYTKVNEAVAENMKNGVIFNDINDIKQFVNFAATVFTDKTDKTPTEVETLEQSKELQKLLADDDFARAAESKVRYEQSMAAYRQKNAKGGFLGGSPFSTSELSAIPDLSFRSNSNRR